LLGIWVLTARYWNERRQIRPERRV
jgi:hypothetical protein